MRSVDYTACLRETLRTYVHRCTLEVLWKLFKSGVNFVHLAAEIAMKMCHLYASDTLFQSPSQGVECMHALVQISIEHAKSRSMVEMCQVGTETAILCCRLGYTRKAILVLAHAASFCSAVTAGDRGASQLWYLGSSLTKSTQCVQLKTWRFIRMFILKQLVVSVPSGIPKSKSRQVSRAGRDGDKELVLRVQIKAANLRVPYHARISGFRLSPRSVGRPVLMFDPFATRHQASISSDQPNQTAHWIEGERHCIAICFEDSLEPAIHTTTTTPLQFCGAECVVHDQVFDKHSMRGCLSIMLLDVTPLAHQHDIKICGASIAVLDDGYMFPCPRQFFGSNLPRQVQLPVVQPQPRIVARVLHDVVGPSLFTQSSADHMTTGYQSGEDLLFELQLEHVGGEAVSCLQIEVGLLSGSNSNSIIFQWGLGDSHLECGCSTNIRHVCNFSDMNELKKLRKLLKHGFNSFNVFMRVKEDLLVHTGLRLTCFYAGSDHIFQRAVAVTVMLAPRPAARMRRSNKERLNVK